MGEGGKVRDEVLRHQALDRARWRRLVRVRSRVRFQGEGQGWAAASIGKAPISPRYLPGISPNLPHISPISRTAASVGNAAHARRTRMATKLERHGLGVRVRG